VQGLRVLQTDTLISALCFNCGSELIILWIFATSIKKLLRAVDFIELNNVERCCCVSAWRCGKLRKLVVVTFVSRASVAGGELWYRADCHRPVLGGLPKNFAQRREQNFRSLLKIFLKSEVLVRQIPSKRRETVRLEIELERIVGG